MWGRWGAGTLAQGCRGDPAAKGLTGFEPFCCVLVSFKEQGKAEMQEASYAGAAGEEERSAGPVLPMLRLHTWDGSAGQTWSSAGHRGRGNRKGLDFLSVQTLRVCWSSALQRLGQDMVWDVPTLGVPRTGAEMLPGAGLHQPRCFL